MDPLAVTFKMAEVHIIGVVFVQILKMSHKFADIFTNMYLETLAKLYKI